MKILNIDPRTPAWQEVRNESWIASMAPVLVVKDNAILLREYALKKGIELDIEPLLAVGLDSYFGHTLWSLWAHTNGVIPRQRETRGVSKESENVDFVIREFEKSNMLVCHRAVTARATGNEWMAASFDAIVPQVSNPFVSARFGFPLEAKAPSFPSRKKLWDSKKAGDLAIKGLVNYWCEMQHQLFVAEAPYGWFSAIGVELDQHTGTPAALFPIMERIPRDESYLTAYVAAAKFYHTEFMLNYGEPPRLPADEQLIEDLNEKAELDQALANGDDHSAVDLYIQAQQAEEKATKRRKYLEERLVTKARTMKPSGPGVVNLTPDLQILFSETNSVSWEKVAKTLAKQLGKSEIPAEVITAWQSTPKESVKLKKV